MRLSYLIQFFIVVSQLGLLAGCEIREKGEKTTTTPTRVDAAHPPRLTLTLLPLDSPNQYAVHLYTTSSEKAITYRATGNESPKEILLAARPGMTGLGLDEDVAPGVTYRYWLVENGEHRPDNNDPFGESITIPQDVLIRRDLTAEAIRTTGRIFLDRATIQSRERLLYIEAQEIISNDGVLQSFAKNRQAPTGADGREGGLIYLKVRRGSGKLLIAARGEGGGAGGPGKKGEKGPNGRPGLDAEIAVRSHLPPPVREAYQKLLMKLPEEVDPLHRDWGKLFYCAKAPNDGAPGEKGGTGEAGQKGGNGGSSARLWIAIADPSQLELDIEKTPGQGGAGGKGGAGGEGGAGGAPGLRDRHHLCPSAKSGATGPAGDEGKHGENGATGSLGSTCVMLGRSKVGDCEQAPHFDPHIK